MRNALGIWLPGMETRPTIGKCGLCQKEFYEGETAVMWRHIKWCSDENLHKLTDELPDRKVPGIFGPDARDQELEEFISRNREKVERGHRIRL